MAGLDRRKISPPAGIRSQDRPVRSQSLYRLSYPAHSLKHSVIKLHWLLAREAFVHWLANHICHHSSWICTKYEWVYCITCKNSCHVTVIKERLRNQGAVTCKFTQNFQFLWVTYERLIPNACFICKCNNNKSTKVFHILPKGTGTETAKVLCTKEITG